VAGDWKEALEKRIILPDTQASVFEGYLRWLYTGHVTIIDWEDDYIEMSHFYVLGDFLDDIKFRNATLECIMARCLESNRIPDARAVQIAWKKTPSNSLLRQLILELCAQTPFKDSIRWFLKTDPRYVPYPEEFIQQHFERLMSSNALELVQSSKRSRITTVADFKLRMSDDTASGKIITGVKC
jgi:hypothetical protein